MDRCVKIEHARLFGGLHWAGVNTRVVSARRAALTPATDGRPRLPARDAVRIHAGQIPDAATGARAVPIYQTTSYVFDTAEHAASLFNLQTFGNVYTRISNPTVAVFEERVAALEGGRAALAAATGQAAEMTALLTILEPGDHIVAASTLYGGTYTHARRSTCAKLGIETTFVDSRRPGEFRRAIRPNTQGDLRRDARQPADQHARHRGASATIAHEAGVPLIVDNTVPSPYLCRPFDCGADIVVHSATKYIGGHGTTMGGVIVESGQVPLGQRQVSRDDRARRAATTASSSTRPSATSATR